MRIGIVTTWFERGAAYVSRQFMDVLQKTDDVFIYARGGEEYAIGNPKWDLPNVHWGKWNKTKRAIFSSTYIDKKDFVRWLKDNNIEAVLFNEQQWFNPILWCKELGVKTIAYVDYYTEQTIPMFDAYDCLICNTKRHASVFKTHHNCNYIKWGTDLSLYHPVEEKHEKLTFFHSAGMAPVRKGTDILIKAFYQSKGRQKAKLLLHTQLPLGSAIPEVKLQIDELIGEGSLEIVEKTISAPGLYSEGDVYVYPSRLDGIGLTLMEAIASGLAVVTINCAPMNEFVESEFGQMCDVESYYSRYDGYYWPMSIASVKSLTKILEKYISGNFNLEILKKNARLYAEKELDFEKNFSSLHELFSGVELTLVSDKIKQDIINYGNRDLQRFLDPFSFLFISKHFFEKAIHKIFS